MLNPNLESEFVFQKLIIGELILKKKNLSVNVIVILFAFIIFGRLVAQDWSGWRGLEKYGYQPAKLVPSQWSSKSNVQWKFLINGEGHSSPIIIGDHVVLTSADKNQHGGVLLTSLRWIQFFLLIFIAYHVTQKITILSSSANEPWYKHFTHLIFYVPLGTALILIIFFGENLFDYERCNIRRWIASSILFTTCFLFGALNAPKNSRLRQILSLLLFLFGFLFLYFVPSKDHAFRHGIIGTSSLVMYAISAFPLLFGGILVFKPIFRIKQNPSQWKMIFMKKLKMSLYVGLFLLFVILLILLYHRISIENQSPTAQLNTDPYDPFLKYWITAILFGLASGLFGLRVKFGKHLLLDLFLFLVLMGLVISSLINLVEYSAKYSPYFAYQLGNPRLVPTSGWYTFAAFWMCCLMLLLVSIINTLKKKQAKFPAFSKGLSVVFVLLGILYFFPINYLAPLSTFFRSVICLERQSGRIIWEWSGFEEPRGQQHKDNSAATPTPVSDGEKIYAYFGSAGLVCLDLQGNVCWINERFNDDNVYGTSVSPILDENKILITTNFQTKTRFHAIDKNSGEQIWEVDFPKLENSTGLNRPPLILNMNEEMRVVAWGVTDLAAFDLTTGKLCWQFPIDLKQMDYVASIVSDDQQLYLAGLREIVALNTKKLEAQTDPIVWRMKCRGPNIPSPVIAGDLLFAISDNGRAICLEAETGKIFWEKRLPGLYYPSVTVAGDYVYFCNNSGLTTVVAREKQFRQISVNELNEPIFASFAPTESQLFIRTFRHLYAIQFNL